MYKDILKQREWQRNWQNSQRAIRKAKAIAMLGGKCNRCGYNENIAALQIDHIEPLRRKYEEKRKDALTTGSNLARMIANGSIELSTVQLLCANCHCIKTHEEDRHKFSNHRKQ
jgi:hypothetical protein